MLAACGLPDFETVKRREELLRNYAPAIVVGVAAAIGLAAFVVFRRRMGRA
jgi:hypothetical protein